MIDPAREVRLQVGDQEFVLYAGNKALRMLERDTGKAVTELFAEVDRGSVGLMTTALWAMLQSRHPELTIDDVDDIIDTVGYQAIGETLGRAANRAFDAGGEGGEDPDPGKAMALNGATPGTGKRSSRTGSRPA